MSSSILRMVSRSFSVLRRAIAALTIALASTRAHPSGNESYEEDGVVYSVPP